MKKKHLTGTIGTVLAGTLLATTSGLAFAATGPAISSVTVTPSTTGATVSWMTDENANAQVRYGTSTPYTASTTPTTGFTTTTQSVMLSGLTPSTTYHYSVVSSNASGTVSSTTDQTFMTLASSTPVNTANIATNVATGTPGSMFTLSGNGFWNSEMVNLSFANTTGSAQANTNGDWTTTLKVPSSSVSTSTPETISATGVTSGMTATTTFTIVPAAPTSTPTSTTPLIILNPNAGTAGTLVTVTGYGFSAGEAVTINVDGATATVNADMNGNFTGSLNVPATAPTGSFTVTATGGTSGTTVTAPFTVQAGNATSSPDLTTLQNEIINLQNLINQLIARINALFNGNGNNGNGNGNGNNGNGNGNNGNGNGNVGSNLSGTIDHQGPVRAGTTVDFGGRNWGVNEQVQVSNNGNVVTTARADGGGNFSTGSLPVTNTPGTQTYTFTGLTSGITRTVQLTVTP